MTWVTANRPPPSEQFYFHLNPSNIFRSMKRDIFVVRFKNWMNKKAIISNFIKIIIITGRSSELKWLYNSINYSEYPHLCCSDHKFANNRIVSCSQCFRKISRWRSLFKFVYHQCGYGRWQRWWWWYDIVVIMMMTIMRIILSWLRRR